MPLPKRLVEPVHVSRGTIPEELPLPSELEAVTNGTLANAIRQLSSLSRHAEDMFAELARDSRGIATRASNLQARIDRLAVKVTQLDSNVEEVSLQDIHMRKAFKSAVVFDQQVVSRDTMPTAMLEVYKNCDKPPPLDKLNPYRDDGKDGLKFYTDPDYFFDLWRQEMLKDTERMMHDRQGKKPHRPRGKEEGGGRHKKRVRQPHNTRERQRQIAVTHGEYIMPTNQQDHYHQNNVNHYRTPQPIYLQTMMGGQGMGSDVDMGGGSRPSSIELRRSYPGDQVDALPNHVYSPNLHNNQQHHYAPPQHLMYTQRDYAGYEVTVNQQAPAQMPQQPVNMYYTNDVGGQGYTSPLGTPGRSRPRPSQPPPAPPTTSSSTTSTPTMTPTRGGSRGRETLPPPPPPPVETGGMGVGTELPPPPPPPSPPPTAAPPPPPPPPPLPSPPPADAIMNGDVKPIPKQPDQQQVINALQGLAIRPKPLNHVQPATNAPIYDPRSDLLKAIRDGIKLRKVEKSERVEDERGVRALHDVASILARRVAVEFSDSESGSDSEYDSDGWLEGEPPHHHPPPNAVVNQ